MTDTTALDDPFAAIDAGEYGADVCIHRDDISTEFPNEILEILCVRVDENRNLRRVDSNRFVRNVVDDRADATHSKVKQMLADIPADATESDRYVSALFRDVIPPSFIRLDNPQDDNVVTKVMSLNTDVSKIKLLMSLGRVAQQDDFTAEDLDSMEGALDTFAELDDTENVDQYIRERLL